MPELIRFFERTRKEHRPVNMYAIMMLSASMGSILLRQAARAQGFFQSNLYSFCQDVPHGCKCKVGPKSDLDSNCLVICGCRAGVDTKTRNKTKTSRGETKEPQKSAGTRKTQKTKKLKLWTQDLVQQIGGGQQTCSRNIDPCFLENLRTTSAKYAPVLKKNPPGHGPREAVEWAFKHNIKIP